MMHSVKKWVPDPAPEWAIGIAEAYRKFEEALRSRGIDFDPNTLIERAVAKGDLSVWIVDPRGLRRRLEPRRWKEGCTDPRRSIIIGVFMGQQWWDDPLHGATVYFEKENWQRWRDDQYGAEQHKTGDPGRPSSRHLYEAEFARRAEAKQLCSNLNAEAKHLASWIETQYPTAPRVQPKTIENRIRERYNSAKYETLK